ncbi:class I SAM-dependent methyltransferase [Streptomyces tubercidicus]
MPHTPERAQLPPANDQLQSTSPPQHTTLARAFDAVAAQYAAARPGYPPALFDAIEELAGQPLAGARVLDVGAGTGIATGLLTERGARVTAVEPGAAMAAELHAAHPATPLVRALGDALPFRDDAAFDLVGYAQAWHWTDPARSVPEAWGSPLLLKSLGEGPAPRLRTRPLVERPGPGRRLGRRTGGPDRPNAYRATTPTASPPRPPT